MGNLARKMKNRNKEISNKPAPILILVAKSVKSIILLHNFFNPNCRTKKDYSKTNGNNKKPEPMLVKTAEITLR